MIGTGSSAILLIPVLVDQAADLFAFQRTPNFNLFARNEVTAAEYKAWWKANYPTLRRSMQLLHAFKDLMIERVSLGCACPISAARMSTA